MDEATLLKAVIQSGPLVAFMLWIIWNQRQANAALQNCVQVVQDKRFEAMERHIQKLETKSDTCESDRIKIWQENARLQEQISELKLRAS